MKIEKIGIEFYKQICKFLKTPPEFLPLNFFFQNIPQNFDHVQVLAIPLTKNISLRL